MSERCLFKAEATIADCARCGEDAVVIEIDGEYFARPRRFSNCKYYKNYLRRYDTNRHVDICRTGFHSTPEDAASEWRRITNTASRKPRPADAEEAEKDNVL